MDLGDEPADHQANRASDSATQSTSIRSADEIPSEAKDQNPGQHVESVTSYELCGRHFLAHNALTLHKDFRSPHHIGSRTCLPYPIDGPPRSLLRRPRQVDVDANA